MTRRVAKRSRTLFDTAIACMALSKNRRMDALAVNGATSDH
ncbi:hypothetical protein [Xanthomonas arboricola]|nr:hypothetical protein [Xanthomonas arboricola]